MERRAASPLTGGCMCGAVRYEVSAPPQHAGYCHCTRCQRRTGGAASLSARLRPGSFTIVEGGELVGVYAPEEGYEKAFCSRCGSALFSRDPNDHQIIGVRMGTFDGDGLPRYPESRPR